jgi:hypothetical protein
MQHSGEMNVINRMMVAVLPAHREKRPLTVKERPQVRFHGTLHGPHDKRSGECDGSFLSCLSRLMPLSRAFRATSASHWNAAAPVACAEEMHGGHPII